MTVKDILKTTALMLQRNDILEFLSGGGKEETKIECDKLLSCYHLTISELCEEYLPLEFEETVKSKTGEYSYSDFTYPPIEILNVKSRGEDVKYNVCQLSLNCTADEITVRYRYYPKTQNLDDICPYTGTPISHRVIAFGVAREYLLLSGLYDEALVYDDKFTNSLSNVLFTSKGGTIKARGWF